MVKEFIQSKIDETKLFNEKIQSELTDEIVGKSIKIISDYNGQPYGSSKKSLKGEIFTVKGVSIGFGVCYLVTEELDHYINCSIELKEIEFIDG